MDREFTDPFTGEVLDNPTRKTYEVEYSVEGESGRFVKEISTLAENKPTKAQAAEKVKPSFGPFSGAKHTIHSIKKVDEGGHSGGGLF